MPCVEGLVWVRSAGHYAAHHVVGTFCRFFTETAKRGSTRWPRALHPARSQAETLSRGDSYSVASRKIACRPFPVPG